MTASSGAFATAVSSCHALVQVLQVSRATRRMPYLRWMQQEWAQVLGEGQVRTNTCPEEVVMITVVMMVVAEYTFLN